MYAGFGEDLEDLKVVVKYLAETYGYEVDLLVGHSRGSVVALHWLCTTEEGARCGGMVNVSGRYRMDVRTFNLHLLLSHDTTR